MSTRKFYKTVIKVTVLSEESFTYNNLADVHNAITNGDCSGAHSTVSVAELSGKDVVKALQAQGSDPCFFQLKEDGEDIE